MTHGWPSLNAWKDRRDDSAVQAGSSRRELIQTLHLPVGSRKEWQDALFPDGQLHVPSPADGHRWALFRAWAAHVNPDLEQSVTELSDIALSSMNDVIHT